MPAMHHAVLRLWVSVHHKALLLLALSHNRLSASHLKSDEVCLHAHPCTGAEHVFDGLCSLLAA